MAPGHGARGMLPVTAVQSQSPGAGEVSERPRVVAVLATLRAVDPAAARAAVEIPGLGVDTGWYIWRRYMANKSKQMTSTWLYTDQFQYLMLR